MADLPVRDVPDEVPDAPVQPADLVRVSWFFADPDDPDVMEQAWR